MYPANVKVKSIHALTEIMKQRVKKAGASPLFSQHVEKTASKGEEPCSNGRARGVAARLESDRMPLTPCLARREAGAARTFALLRSVKVTALFRQSKKSKGLF